MKLFFSTLLFFVITLGHVLAQADYYSYTNKNFRDATIFKETIVIDSLDFARLNAVVFYLTNEQRAKKNLNMLEYNPLLEKAAEIHSECMRDDDFFDHINKGSKKLRDPNDRARFVGIQNPYMAENIIESFVLRYKAGEEVYPGPPGVFRSKPKSDPILPHSYLSLGESMIKDYMNSSMHKQNILSKEAEQLGCGSALYFKTDFNSMPAVFATQNFQLHEKIRVME